MRLRRDIGRLLRLLPELKKHGAVDMRAIMFALAHILLPERLLRKTANLVAIGRDSYSSTIVRVGTN
jgi:hypothetical protein